jgi:hypothetical protein
VPGGGLAPDSSGGVKGRIPRLSGRRCQGSRLEFSGYGGSGNRKTPATSGC